MEARATLGPCKDPGPARRGWHAGWECLALKACFFFLFLSLNAETGHASVVDATGIWLSVRSSVCFSPLQI